MARNKKTSTPVESVKHKDKRANIPTEELRDFVAEDEKKPKAILYPRDTSLDPQLVWTGLFADFNGIEFERLIEFYQHKDGVNWANRMILGDSLLVMTSLAEKEALKGIGFDLLVICGFAFDAHSRGTAKEFSPEKPKKLDGFVVAEESRQ